MENANEKKALEFMDYIASNLPELKKALKKNISYDNDIFEDVISESILKIYNSISKNGTEITDYKQYFFIVSKFTYIYRDNKKKKNDTIEVRDLFDNGDFDIYDDDVDMEERFDSTLTALSQIKKHIADEFGEMDADIYMTYMRKRTEGRTSYKELSEMYGISTKEISNIVTKIKKHLMDSDAMEKIKKEYYN